MMAGVAPPSSFVLVRRDGGGWLVGHIGTGNGVAGLVQARSEDAALSYTATVLAGHEPVHGGNAGGLVCAALDGGPAGRQLVIEVLSRAASVEAAGEVLGALPVEQRLHEVTLLLVDAARAAIGSVTAGGVQMAEAEGAGHPGESPAGPGAPLEQLAALLARVRAIEPPPADGAAPAAGLAALLVPGEPPRLHLALGPPSCAVFIRHWPGMELVPEESAGPEGAPLARLAAAVAQLSSGDSQLRRAARDRLDAAEAEALREGEAAERMAARMDADTDDRGAAVRRLVAQSHAAELARAALEELAVPVQRAPHPGRAYNRPRS